MATPPVLLNGPRHIGPGSVCGFHTGIVNRHTMSDQPDTDDGSEYRPTDYLATCRLSWGYSFDREQAIENALRYAGPFDMDGDDGDEPITVRVWECYADSWQSHSPRGPERSAEVLTTETIEIPREEANEVQDKARKAVRALDWAIEESETVDSWERPDEADEIEAE